MFSESEWRRPSLGHRDVKSTMFCTHALNACIGGSSRHRSMRSDVVMEDIMPISMRYLDKDRTTAQQPAIPQVMLETTFLPQGAYEVIVPYFGCYRDQYRLCFTNTTQYRSREVETSKYKGGSNKWLQEIDHGSGDTR